MNFKTMKEKKEFTVVLDMIGGTKFDKQREAFMHYADIFDPGKRLGKKSRLVLKTAIYPTPEQLDIICENIKKAILSVDGYVLFIAVRHIDGLRLKDPRAIIEQGVQTISDGKKWGVFKDYLLQMGYLAETNEFMVVTKVYGYNT